MVFKAQKQQQQQQQQLILPGIISDWLVCESNLIVFMNIVNFVNCSLFFI